MIAFDLAEASGDAEGDKSVMIIRDIYTGIIMGYPVGRKNATTVINSTSWVEGRSSKRISMVRSSMPVQS